MFDSIRDDLNTRLLIADKATTTEAQAGTNDTHYTTPAKVKEQLQYLTKTGSASNKTTTLQTTTIYNSSNVPNGAKRVKITGRIYIADNVQSACYLKINGSGGAVLITNNSSEAYFSSQSLSSSFAFDRENNTGSFQIEIDLNARNYSYLIDAPVSTGTYYRGYFGIGQFSSLTSVQVQLVGSPNANSSTTNYTVTYSY